MAVPITLVLWLFSFPFESSAFFLRAEGSHFLADGELAFQSNRHLTLAPQSKSLEQAKGQRLPVELRRSVCMFCHCFDFGLKIVLNYLSPLL